MYLLDTNVVSEIRKMGSPKIDANVAAWWAGRKLTSFFISVMTIFEIEEGILRVGRRDIVQGDILRDWLDRSVVPSFERRTLPVTPEIARASAALMVPDKRKLADALIAATARVHDLKLATRNVVDFEASGVDVIDPWRDRS